MTAMSTLALSHLIHETPILNRLAAGVSGFLAGIRDAQAMHRRYETLSRMSDVELAALGLKREDIPRAVVNAANGCA
jgi:hypothetical protein